MQKILDKILVRIRLYQLRADRLIRKAVQDGMKKEVEETIGCTHDNLKKLIKTDTWYQCKDCGMIINLYDVPAWHKKDFKKILKELSEKVK